MSIIQTIYVQSSVGRNGRNKAADVAAVQSQLNAQMSAPRVALVDNKIDSRAKLIVKWSEAPLCMC